MIIDIKNKDDYVIAYVVFQVVDEESRMCKDGNHLFINGFWVHPEYRWNMKQIFNNFVHDIYVHPECQNLEYAYWQRDKNDKIVKYHVVKFFRKLYRGQLLTGENYGKAKHNNDSGNYAKSNA